MASFYPVRVAGEIIGVGNVVMDITERTEALAFRQIVMDNMAEGLYTLDAEGRVTSVIPAASRMLGSSEEELLGKPMHETIHFQDADHRLIPVEQCELLEVRVLGRTLRSSDATFTRKDGSTFPVAFSSAPLQTMRRSKGVVVVFRDATDEKREEEALRRELAALSWVGRIRDALDEDRLVLYSQPIVPLVWGRPAEEVLLRMVDRDGNIVLPGEFLPAAEKYGLIAKSSLGRRTKRRTGTGHGSDNRVQSVGSLLGVTRHVHRYRAADSQDRRRSGRPSVRAYRDCAHD